MSSDMFPMQAKVVEENLIFTGVLIMHDAIKCS